MAHCAATLQGVLVQACRPPCQFDSCPAMSAFVSPDLTLAASKPRRVRVRTALIDALPLILGYLPIGFAFGVFALGQGVSAFNTLLMAVMVYAASSQLVAVKLLASGAPLLSVVATTFVINLRHLLMSSVLAPYLRHFKRRELAVFALQLCDEAFAVHSLAFSKRKARRAEVFAVNMGLHIAWLLGVGAALWVRCSPERQLALGLDFTPVAMFIGLLVLLIKDRLQLLVVVVCGLLAVGLRMAHVQGWDIVIATVVGATVGLGCDKWISRKSSSPSSA